MKTYGKSARLCCALLSPDPPTIFSAACESRAGKKICWPQGCVGSTPSAGTTFLWPDRFTNFSEMLQLDMETLARLFTVFSDAR